METEEVERFEGKMNVKVQLRSLLVSAFFLFFSPLIGWGLTDSTLQITFLLSEDLLLGQILSSNQEALGQGTDEGKLYEAHIVDLKNAAWKISNRLYDCWSARYPSTFQLYAWANIRSGGKEMMNYLDKVKATPEFKVVLGETQTRLDFCRTQWETQFPTTMKFIQKVTGLTVSGSFTVYIGYPGLPGGCNFADNEIFWGGREDFPNYTSVYLWHELLHFFIPSPGNRPTDLDHALIQLIADNEIRTHLDPKGKPYPPFEGHDLLAALETRILPFWKEYLEHPQDGILEFRRTLIEEKKVDPWFREKREK